MRGRDHSSTAPGRLHTTTTGPAIFGWRDHGYFVGPGCVEASLPSPALSPGSSGPSSTHPERCRSPAPPTRTRPVPGTRRQPPRSWCSCTPAGRATTCPAWQPRAASRPLGLVVPRREEVNRAAAERGTSAMSALRAGSITADDVQEVVQATVTALSARMDWDWWVARSGLLETIGHTCNNLFPCPTQLVPVPASFVGGYGFEAREGRPGPGACRVRRPQGRAGRAAAGTQRPCSLVVHAWCGWGWRRRRGSPRGAWGGASPARSRTRSGACRRCRSRSRPCRGCP